MLQRPQHSTQRTTRKERRGKQKTTNRWGLTTSFCAGFLGKLLGFLVTEWFKQ